ncbi:RNA polymerase sigma factor [Saccharothrix luteola]|uniref:RNA polymerase sigma factor n=1 Tax=Saccharothrix luteola TaxID=2893018 RepID=UPI001E497107|nr:sigma factor-like helix-turn-helix DNA-binding protein [Saccharothrix luteola]MCC8247647.1 LuxR C-terminal-related transcriptional regulator [Saccharothrix luteola]
MFPPTTEGGRREGKDPMAAMLRDCWVELAAYIRNRLDPHEHHETEMFMQEAAVDFVNAWYGKGPPRTRNDAIARLKASAKKDLLNHWAKQERRRTSPYAIDDQVLLNHAHPDSEDEVLALLGRIDCQRLGLNELLPRLLTERQREIVAAVAVDEVAKKDVADQLGVSLRSVQKHYANALERLRTHLESEPAQGTSRENPA